MNAVELMAENLIVFSVDPEEYRIIKAALNPIATFFQREEARKRFGSNEQRWLKVIKAWEKAQNFAGGGTITRVVLLDTGTLHIFFGNGQLVTLSFSVDASE